MRYSSEKKGASHYLPLGLPCSPAGCPCFAGEQGTISSYFEHFLARRDLLTPTAPATPASVSSRMVPGSGTGAKKRISVPPGLLVGGKSDAAVKRAATYLPLETP